MLLFITELYSAGMLTALYRKLNLQRKEDILISKLRESYRLSKSYSQNKQLIESSPACSIYSIYQLQRTVGAGLER